MSKKNFSMVSFGERDALGLADDLTGAPSLDYLGLAFHESTNTYFPPINRSALARLPQINAQHGGILHSRVNMVSAGFLGGELLSRVDMRALCLNLIQFGDVALLKIRNGFGKVIRLHVLSSLCLRVGKNGEFHYLVRKSPLSSESKCYLYPASEIIFIKLYDPQQQIYGAPDYLGGIQSALLNADATKFRRRYYSNGAHMGFILYSTDPEMTEEMEEEIAEKIKSSKGVGNFRSMFVNIANGDPNGLKIIPIGDAGQKDEFANIKNISAQDVLTAHRFPPGLGGIIPSNTGGLGDPLKIREAYHLDEVVPLQEMIADAINSDADIAPKLYIQFKPFNNDV